MRCPVRVVFIAVLVSLFAFPAFPSDVPGSKDHPLLPRITGYYIGDYQEVEFGSHDFIDAEGDYLTVEGRRIQIEYDINEGESPPGDLFVIVNYERAASGAGGSFYRHRDDMTYLTLQQDSTETWAEVMSQGDGQTYWLVIVEKGVAEQRISANEMARALKTAGRVSLSIHFDTGKAVIRTESQAIIDEIFQMMTEDGRMRLKVEGHTDSVGNEADNLALSKDRAMAVVQSLVEKGIEPERLEYEGFGELRPVSDNETASGRAKNRRVDLVLL
ncbi:MAG TPA: OmpA family protein [Synergistales bacterium]|nr:OmpA family protein [Synergistales bacterium]